MQPEFGAHDSEAEPVIDTTALTAAVPVGEMPPFLQVRIKRIPPTITIEDVRALEPDERAKVLAVVERATIHHKAAAARYRNRGGPADLTAENLAAFLGAIGE
jgi:hypothetical protein